MTYMHLLLLIHIDAVLLAVVVALAAVVSEPYRLRRRARWEVQRIEFLERDPDSIFYKGVVGA